MIQPKELEEKVYEAAKASFQDLLKSNPDESFYTFGLWTDDSLQFLNPVANTEAHLDSTVSYYNKEVDPEYGCTTTSKDMRWSYGDWGFAPEDSCLKYFEEINESLTEIFALEVSDEEFIEIIHPLWDSIIEGLNRLNQEDFWGTKEERAKITVLIVGDLSEELSDACTSALNPFEVAETYLNWHNF